MLDFAIAIDARPVAGELGLYEQLRPLLLQGGRNDIVLHHFAGAALAFHTPLTLFGNLKAGEHGTDIKKGGVFPLVHGLRALALRHGVADRNSFRRATAIAAAGGMSAELARDVQQALGVFLRFRLGQQLDAMRRGEPPDNYLRPAALRRLDRELLRDALAVVDAFKAHVKRSFHL
jgi:CBS domain-containing protein